MKKFNDWMKEKALGMKKDHPHKIVDPGTVEKDLMKPVKKEKDSLN